MYEFGQVRLRWQELEVNGPGWTEEQKHRKSSFLLLLCPQNRHKIDDQQLHGYQKVTLPKSFDIDSAHRTIKLPYMCHSWQKAVFLFQACTLCSLHFTHLTMWDKFSYPSPPSLPSIRVSTIFVRFTAPCKQPGTKQVLNKYLRSNC